KQKENLQVVKVEEEKHDKETAAHIYNITYAKRPDEAKAETRLVYINQPEGANRAEREADVKKRAQELPDLSVELIYLRSDEQATGNRSRYFTARTVEKEAKLVQASLDRLLQKNQEGRWQSLLQKTEMSFVIPEAQRAKVKRLWYEVPSKQAP